jgi:hypothetical protein
MKGRCVANDHDVGAGGGLLEQGMTIRSEEFISTGDMLYVWLPMIMIMMLAQGAACSSKG